METSDSAVCKARRILQNARRLVEAGSLTEAEFEARRAEVLERLENPPQQRQRELEIHPDCQRCGAKLRGPVCALCDYLYQYEETHGKIDDIRGIARVVEKISDKPQLEPCLQRRNSLELEHFERKNPHHKTRPEEREQERAQAKIEKIRRGRERSKTLE